jgi:hypothetical protein
MNGVLPWLVRCAGTRDFCFALAALVSPVQNVIFLIAYFFTFLVPFAQQPGQTDVLGRLSLCVAGLNREVLCLKIYFHLKEQCCT